VAPLIHRFIIVFEISLLAGEVVAYGTTSVNVNVRGPFVAPSKISDIVCDNLAPGDIATSYGNVTEAFKISDSARPIGVMGCKRLHATLNTQAKYKPK